MSGDDERSILVYLSRKLNLDTKGGGHRMAAFTKETIKQEIP